MSCAWQLSRIPRSTAFGAPVPLLICLACFCGCVSATDVDLVARAVPYQVVEEFDISTDDRALIVPVTWEGRKLWFLVGTEATMTVYDSSLESSLGTPLQDMVVTRGGRDVRVKLFSPPKAFLGKIDMQQGKAVMCLDLRTVSYGVGRHIAGGVGMDILKRYVLQLDFDNGKLRLIAPTDAAPQDWGIPVPLFCDARGKPWVSGSVSGRHIAFVVDTGNGGTGSLEAALFRRFIEDAGGKSVERFFGTTTGMIRNRTGRLPLLVVGGREYRDLLFDRSEISSLGLLFLSRHCVTLDFPNGRMFLRRGRGFGRSDEVDMSGLSLFRIEARTVVHAVDESSPAAEVGIKASDEILSVNGVRTTELAIGQVSRAFKSGDGNEITMTIKRGEKVFDVSFRLKREL